LSQTIVVPRGTAGESQSRSQGWKTLPSIAPSITSGAVIPIVVRAARHLRFGPWLRGTRPTTRSPRGTRPRVRVRLVCVLVSSRTTTRSVSQPAISVCQAARASASCSVAINDFF
jgi:hypothetical protein